MSEIDAYKRVIVVLTDSENWSKDDWKQIAFDYAKRYPKDFIIACNNTDFNYWKTECKNLLNAGQKVEAIKVCRKATGKCLKDAKELVESL